MDVIDGEIFAAISSPAVKFVDHFTPWDGCFFASVQNDQTQRQVEKLHNLLKRLAPRRFPYATDSGSPHGARLAAACAGVSERECTQTCLKVLVNRHGAYGDGPPCCFYASSRSARRLDRSARSRP